MVGGDLKPLYVYILKKREFYLRARERQRNYSEGLHVSMKIIIKRKGRQKAIELEST